jgi:hypothetical protein
VLLYSLPSVARPFVTMLTFLIDSIFFLLVLFFRFFRFSSSFLTDSPTQNEYLEETVLRAEVRGSA